MRYGISYVTLDKESLPQKSQKDLNMSKLPHTQLMAMWLHERIEKEKREGGVY